MADVPPENHIVTELGNIAFSSGSVLSRACCRTSREGEVHSLVKEGWTRHQKNAAKPPLMERTGWFVQLPIIGGFNEPPRLRPLRRLRAIFLVGASTPPLPRRGLRSTATVPGAQSAVNGTYAV